MIFILQDIVVCAVASFTIGLYAGAFVQRRRDIKAFRIEKSITEYKKKLDKELAECEEK